ncbi:hypothetical protein ACVDG5_012145 [Mesorhizobium sp. ORM6]
MSRPVRLGGIGISYDIAIAGAGPAGLAMALYLKRASGGTVRRALPRRRRGAIAIQTDVEMEGMELANVRH